MPLHPSKLLSCLLIGSYLRWGNQPEQQRDNIEFIRRLAEWAGVGNPVTTSLDGTVPPLVARLHEGDRGYLLFLVNHDSTARDVSATMQVPAGAYALVLTTCWTRIIRLSAPPVWPRR